MIAKDRIKGSAEQAKGKAKEWAGKVTGDKKTEAEGRAEHVKGKSAKRGRNAGQVTDRPPDRQRQVEGTPVYRSHRERVRGIFRGAQSSAGAA